MTMRWIWLVPRRSGLVFINVWMIIGVSPMRPRPHWPGAIISVPYRTLSHRAQVRILQYPLLLSIDD
jgi:hypothetical protein